MWYREGRVAVTNNSTEVHGTGTQWVEGVWVGDAFQGPDGRQYEITNIASNTALSIAPAYIGPSVANQVYWTIPIPGRNKSLADRVAKATATFEDAADASSAYADESKLYSNQSKQFSLDAKAFENQAKAAETSSKTHADRSQQAADDAVATVTGGTASIDPKPGKIPLAGADAAIKQAWVKDLVFELDALRAARNRLQYGDGPYPVMDFQFIGAERSDPKIVFTRASKDWGYDKNGVLKEYGVDEPVFDYDPITGESLGLRSWGRRTNLLVESKSLSFSVWGPVRMYVETEGEWHKLIPRSLQGSHQFRQLNIPVTGETVSSFFAKQGEYRYLRYRSAVDSVFFEDAVFDLFTGEKVAGRIPVDRIAIKGNRDAGFYFEIVNAASEGTFFDFDFWVYGETISPDFTGDDEGGLYVKGVQLEEGVNASPYIPTGSSQVTVAGSLAQVEVAGLMAGEWSLMIGYAHDSTASSQRFLEIRGDTNNYVWGVASTLSQTGGGYLHKTVDGVNYINAGGSIRPERQQLYQLAVSNKEKEYSTSLNGGEVHTIDSPKISNLTTLTLGSRYSRTSHIDGYESTRLL